MAKIFTIYDSKAEAWSTPLFFRSRGEAVRAWTASVNDAESPYAKFPSDFTAFEIGDFDERTGNVSLYESKVSLGLALDFIKPSVENLTLPIKA